MKKRIILYYGLCTIWGIVYSLLSGIIIYSSFSECGLIRNIAQQIYSIRTTYGTYVFLIVLSCIIIANIYALFRSYREKARGFNMFILVITGVFVGIIVALLTETIMPILCIIIFSFDDR